MNGIVWLCNRFPTCKRQFIWLGYLILIFGTAFWFLCFPTLAFTLYFFDKFPGDFIHIDPNRPPLPKHAMMIFAALVTIIGIPIIYFSIKTLSRLRSEGSKN